MPARLRLRRQEPGLRAGRRWAELLPRGDGLAGSWRPYVAHLLATAFCLYGLVAVALLAALVPPFQNPDELAHYLRAAGVADGALMASRITTTWPYGTAHRAAGGPSDPAIVASFLPFEVLPFHPDRRAAAAMWERKADWSAARTWEDYSGPATYAPAFYLPSAAGVLVGRLARMPVTQTLVLSRVLTGLCAVALGTAAIAIAEASAVLLFAILTLPMALSLIASAAQDGVMLGAAALTGALILRQRRGLGASARADCIGLAVLLGLLGMARLPYLGLALGLAGLSRSRLPARWRALAALAVGGATLGWVALTAIFTMPDVGFLVHADATAQLAYLGAHPLAVPDIAARTLATYGAAYLNQFVGQLGWADTVLPAGYRGAAVVVLIVALGVACIGPRAAPPRCSGGLWLVSGLVVSAAAVFALQYLTWTPPGHAIVEGVQGRYFLPLALAGAGMLPVIRSPLLQRLRPALAAIVALFPVISLATTMQAIVWRYYLG